MADYIAMAAAGACLIGPWFTRSRKQAALLCLLCVIAFLVAGFIPSKWISAAEGCPDHLPPTGHVSCGDNAEVVMLAALLVFSSSFMRLVAKEYLIWLVDR